MDGKMIFTSEIGLIVGTTISASSQAALNSLSDTVLKPSSKIESLTDKSHQSASSGSSYLLHKWIHYLHLFAWICIRYPTATPA